MAFTCRLYKPQGRMRLACLHVSQRQQRSLNGCAT